jgi:hypothetical protein
MVSSVADFDLQIVQSRSHPVFQDRHLRPVRSASYCDLASKDVALVGPRKTFQGCSQPRSSPHSCMRSPTYVAQRFMWRSLQDARKDAPFGADKRHIT